MLETRDRRIWRYTANGIFNTQSAYLALVDDELDGSNGDWRWLWKIAAPARWLHFIWLVQRGRLLTNSLWASWGMGDAACRLWSCRRVDFAHHGMIAHMPIRMKGALHRDVMETLD
ncbi:hypothetical protein COLO4_36608 [Corchorus olitorius]|uniref:Reverse transcriptase zinc-binding domain-containing protein n=1 Tax=Corchorus olitorius TaxID=93759 RepID=A0A1R3G7F1_9ROSI|nr:hypothetical protein COLO4_36608 [Corchorus olitorius]